MSPRRGPAPTGGIRRTAGGWAIRYRDGRGVRRQRSGFRTKAEAREVLDDELRKARLGPVYRPDVTLRELVDVFLEQYEGAPSSKDRLDQYLGKATAYFKDEPVSSLDALAIARWRASLPETMRHGAHRALRQVLSAAVRWRWIEHNVAGEIKNPVHAREEFTPFESWEEVDALACELGPFGALAIFCVGTGVRPEEAFGAGWTDVDLQAGVFTALSREVWATTGAGDWLLRAWWLLCSGLGAGLGGRSLCPVAFVLCLLRLSVGVVGLQLCLVCLRGLTVGERLELVGALRRLTRSGFALRADAGTLVASSVPGRRGCELDPVVASELLFHAGLERCSRLGLRGILDLVMVVGDADVAARDGRAGQGDEKVSATEHSRLHAAKHGLARARLEVDVLELADLLAVGIDDVLALPLLNLLDLHALPLLRIRGR